MPPTTVNSRKAGQVVVDDDDDVYINYLLFSSERNSDRIAFPLPILKRKFTQPLAFLYDDIVDTLAICYNFQADLSTIRVYTLKTDQRIAEFKKISVGNIDIQTIADFHDPTEDIQTILGAPESLNRKVLHLLITAAEKVEPPSRASPESPLHKLANELWKKAWGKSWPTTKSSISIEETVEGEPMLIDDDDANPMPRLEDDADSRWNYTFLSDIGSVAAACSAPGFGSDSDFLVIRKEYPWLRDKLQELRAANSAVVVIGHQGIGKSMFLLFLLLYLLEKKQPTAIHLSDDVVVFNDKGATICTPKSKNKLVGYWALTDSNVDINIPCPLFRGSKAFIVQTTSPREDRWKDWIKYRGGTVVVSELPREIEIAAIIKQIKLEYQQATHYIRKWGPCTRTIIKILTAPTAVRSSVEVTLAHAAKSAAETVCNNPAVYMSIALPGLAHSQGSAILFARPYRPPHKVYSDAGAKFAVPTAFLDDIFHTAATSRTNSIALDLFFALSSHSLTRTSAGWVLEQSVHRALCSDNAFDIRRTLRPAESPASPGKIAVDPRDTSRTIQASQKLLCGTVSALARVANFRTFYWIPSVANFPGVDSVLANDDDVYAIQVTLSNEHSNPGDGLKKLWQSYDKDVRAQRTWHLIVVADNDELARKHEVDFARLGITLGPEKVPVRFWSCVYNGQ
ncbi:hypothetical protein EUX98_g8802 [Antrodiella citrinella]|uniref:Uncharacterized protein n=1 Tax=Antrodiella citrinella TaxID=2447956 RepID=A0A4S4M8U6_9APHY|nr:hypothetical protein EUX98_g8802 [Antrodiella citrinella]